MFADATGDHQWIHVDVDRATAGPFGGTIAHGYLTLSLVPVARPPGVRASRRPAPSSTTASTRCGSPHPCPSAPGSGRTPRVADVADLPAGNQVTLG